MKPYSSDEGVINYDECEWRMFIPKNGKYRETKEKCKWFWDKDEFKGTKEEKGDILPNGNKKLFFNAFQLNLPFEAIEKIVVPDDENKRIFCQRVITSDFIMGREVTEEDKLQMCSKSVVA